MRAFHLLGFERALVHDDKPTPKPTGSEVLLQMLTSGVCHSDLHISDGSIDPVSAAPLACLKLMPRNARLRSTAARSRPSIPRCPMLTRKFARPWVARFTLCLTWWEVGRPQRRVFGC